MKINYNWIKEYLEGDVPSEKSLASLLNDHSYEVETMESMPDGNVIFDIDILPNRSADSLCHRGVAKEISVVARPAFKERVIKERDEVPSTFLVEVEDGKKCPRYIGQLIKNIKVGESPAWLREKLLSIGQRPINNIVDALNYVMFDMGQPMHAFDADKVNGKIIVRQANFGEKILTLDGKDLELQGGDLVIADEKGILALAGVKGGKQAEVDSATRNIILEAANFHSIAVRSVSRRLPLITDASKRFENGVAIELAELGMKMAVSLIAELAGAPDTVVEKRVDIFPKQRGQYVLGVSLAETNHLLGTEMTPKDLEDIWDRLGFKYSVVNSREYIVKEAPKYLGVPYKYGASVTYDAPNLFDCSSFVAYLFAQAGVSLPRITIDQFIFGEEVAENNLKPGDVIFSDNSYVAGNENAWTVSKEFMPGTQIQDGVSHNGIYVGDGKVVHASGKWHKGEVVMEDYKDSPAFKHIRGFRRMVGEEERYAIEIPRERLDLRIKEDLIEEAGRVYGLNRIKAKLPSLEKFDAEINKELYWREKIKDILVGFGFDEVYTYSFNKNGEVELLNPISKEMPFMRPSLEEGLQESYILNTKNKPILGLESVKIFEIGKVFGKEGEHLELGIMLGNKHRNILKDIEESFKENLEHEVNLKVKEDAQVVFAVLNLSAVFKELSTPSRYDWDDSEIVSSYESISNYPFVLRDIAIWVPKEEPPENLLSIIKSKSGALLKRADLFDRFEKEGRVSYAYHLVFQSTDKTLTDMEVNEIMDEIYKELDSRKFQIR